MQNGKGSTRRPAQVPQKVIDSNWGEINWKSNKIKKQNESTKKIQVKQKV